MIISGTAASSAHTFLGLPDIFPVPEEEREGYFPCEVEIPVNIDIRVQRSICSFADLEDSLYFDDFGDNHGFIKPENQMSPIQQALAKLMDDAAFDHAATAELVATFRSLFTEHCDSYKEWNTLPVNPARFYIPNQNYDHTGTEVDVLILAMDGPVKIGDAHYKSVGKCRKFGCGCGEYAAIVDGAMLNKQGEKSTDSVFHWVKSTDEVKQLVASFYSQSLRYSAKVEVAYA